MRGREKRRENEWREGGKEMGNKKERKRMTVKYINICDSV